MFEALQFPVKKMAIPHPMHATKDIEGRKAVIRTDTGEVLNIVADRYQLVPHMDVFGVMNEAIDRLGVPVTDIEVVTGDRGGSARVIWRLDRTLNVGVDDDVRLTIVGRNSYNYMSMVGLSLGAFRLICSNGATIGRMLNSQAKRHVPSLKVEVLLREIMNSLEQQERIQTEYRRWDAVEYLPPRLAAWLETRPEVSGKARAEIVEYYTVQPDRRRFQSEPRFTGWEAWNSLTWFGSHRTRARTRSEERVLVAQEVIDQVADAFYLTQLRN